jgi:hypothetical protein
MLLTALIIAIVVGVIIWTAVTASPPRWPLGPDQHCDRDMATLTFDSARPQQPRVDHLPFIALIFEIEQQIGTISF